MDPNYIPGPQSYWGTADLIIFAVVGALILWLIYRKVHDDIRLARKDAAKAHDKFMDSLNGFHRDRTARLARMGKLEWDFSHGITAQQSRQMRRDKMRVAGRAARVHRNTRYKIRLQQLMR